MKHVKAETPKKQVNKENETAYMSVSFKIGDRVCGWAFTKEATDTMPDLVLHGLFKYAKKYLENKNS